MTFLDLLQSYLPLIIFVGGPVIWLIRLESKALTTEKRVDTLEIDTKTTAQNSDSFRERILVKLEGLETSNRFILQALEELKKKRK